MYVKQLAYLRSRAKDATRSRLQILLELDGTPSFPNISDCEYVASLFDEMGGLVQSGMGIAPMSWQEIQAWSSLTGLELDPWEVITLKELSKEYCAMINECDDKNVFAPYTPEVVDAGFSKHVFAVLRSMNRNDQTEEG